MVKNFWFKVVSSAKSGGLGYFLAAMLVVSVRVVVEVLTSDLNVPYSEIVPWLVTLFISLPAGVSFLIGFNLFVEKKWNWKLQTVSDLGYVSIAVWTIAGALFGLLLWWIGFLIF